MQKIIYFLVLLFLSLNAFTQKYDHQWVTGYDNNFNGDLSLLDFTEDTVQSSIYAYLDFELQMSNGGSFICDENGELLLLTNNCSVYTADFELVPGTDTLNPGPSYNNFCEEFGEYPANQSVVILPEMGNDSIYYVVHKDSEINNVLQTRLSYNFYLSVIVQKTDGTFYLREKRKLLDMEMVANRVTACRHAAGDKWWTWAIEYNTNRFHQFLIGGQDTVAGPFVQEVEEPIINEELQVGQAAYSPDGKLMGINSHEYSELVLFDFDNATGGLSNYRTIPYPDTAGTAEGLVFSLDSKLAYVTAGRDLYQIDIEDESVLHIAHHTSISDWNWPVGMGYMYHGPDCRIYISPGTTSNYVHTIHNPNGKGMDCGYQPRAMRMPNNLAFDFPNLPIYRFDGACDSIIAFPYMDTVSTNMEVVENGGVSIYPNPFQRHFTVSFTDRMPSSATIILYDQLGRRVMEKGLPAGSNVFETSSLNPGIYFYEIMERGRSVQGGKMVKN